jgi:hypothetical protein
MLRDDGLRLFRWPWQGTGKYQGRAIDGMVGSKYVGKNVKLDLIGQSVGDEGKLTGEHKWRE